MNSTLERFCTPPVAELARLGEARTFTRKQLLVHEGEPGSELYVVLSGRVRIYTDNDQGRRFVLGSYGPGTLFGEGALDGGPRTASVEALSEVVCSVVPFDLLMQHIEAHPAFAMVLLMEMIGRSRAAMGRMKGLALETVYQRLRRLLMAEARLQEGQPMLGPEWTQQELANHLGASRDMITRLFRDLTAGGYVATGKAGMRVLKPLPEAW